MLITKYLVPALFGLGFPCGSVVKNPTCNAGNIEDIGSIPVSGRSPGGGSGNSLQYSCLANSMDRDDWQSTLLSAGKSRTPLSMHTQTNKHYLDCLAYLLNNRMKTFKDVPHSFECESLFLNMRSTLGIDSGFIGKYLKVVLRVMSLTIQSMFYK